MRKFIWATGLDNYDFGLASNSKRIGGGGKAQNYSDKIAEQCNNGETILLLSELILDTNNARTDLLGIEVLKWLRIRHKVTNPIILFGFLELSQILREHPEHIIITALGVRYMTMPTTIENLTSFAKGLKPVKNIKKQYKKFVQADFKVQQFGHEFANEFGCFELSREIEQIFGIKDFLDKKLFEKKLDWHKLELLYESERTTNTNYIKKSIEQLRALLQNRKAIYVDDKGDSGWFKIIDFLLYEDVGKFEDRRENYFGNERINTQTNKGLNELASQIVKSKPAIVFLDLRLRGAEDKGLEIEEISGSRLLKEIKKLKPELPVLILSATNKIHSLEVLSKHPYSSSGLWTKPRAEQGLNVIKSLEQLLINFFETLSYSDKPYAKFIIKGEYFKNQQVCSPNEKLNEFDHIIFDTNFFCESSDARLYGIYLKCFDNLIEDSELRKKVVLIEDVISELFINSFKSHINRNTGEDNTELVNGIAKNSIQKILNVLATKTIENFRDRISHLLNSNIHYQTYDHKGRWVVSKCRDVIISQFRNEDSAIREWERLNREETHIKSLIYADNVFKYLIKSLSGNRKILFVSDDLLCKKDISSFYMFKSSEHFKVDKEGNVLIHSSSVLLDKVQSIDGDRTIKGVRMVRNSFFSSQFFN